MSRVLGLYPNVIIGKDAKRLCFTLLDSASHCVLEATPDQYAIKGNTITFQSDSFPGRDKIASLVTAGFAYRLTEVPKVIPDNNLHAIVSQLDDVNLDRIRLSRFVLTVVLDDIGSLPVMHYPFLNGHAPRFAKTTLGADRLKDVLSQAHHFRRVRLLSKDILHSNVLMLKELEGLNLETIVNQDYYLAHFDEFAALSRKLKLIVYIDDLTRFDDAKGPSRLNNVSVSFFCQIQDSKDALELDKHEIPIVPFPAPDASADIIHALLDYSVDDILHTKSTKLELYMKKAFNPNFFGRILVDNSGNYFSYPFRCPEDKGLRTLSAVVKNMRGNHFWYLNRSDFFDRCRNCAFVDLCPPLSNYEINLQQTFCLD